MSSVLRNWCAPVQHGQTSSHFKWLGRLGAKRQQCNPQEDHDGRLRNRRCRDSGCVPIVAQAGAVAAVRENPTGGDQSLALEREAAKHAVGERRALDPQASCLRAERPGRALPARPSPDHRCFRSNGWTWNESHRWKDKKTDFTICLPLAGRRQPPRRRSPRCSGNAPLRAWRRFCRRPLPRRCRRCRAPARVRACIGSARLPRPLWRASRTRKGRSR